MREESHLDDMRTAIRGDFDRLAERRGGQELMRAPAEEPEPPTETAPEAKPDALPEPEPAGDAEPAAEPPQPREPPTETAPVSKPDSLPEPELAGDAEPAAEPLPQPPEEPLAEEPPHRSWLDRLLGR